jgi:TonB family protein
MTAGIQGSVLLDAVVREDGTVGDVRVTRSLDPGLDQEAVKALRQSEFEPGTKDGKTVAVKIAAELRFTLE